VELSKEFKGDAYRLVYTTKFAEMLPVLRVFIKQSKSGIATPLHEVRLIRHRYREAVRLDAKRKRRHGR
jgi:phage-related protein